jgi:uncharacterized protein
MYHLYIPSFNLSTNSHQLNTISWTQIPATDLDRVQKFYHTIFGWAFNTFSAAQCCDDPAQASAYKDLNMKPEDPMFVMFRFSEKDFIPHGGFVKVKPDNQLSPALHPDNAKKEKLSVNSTITVRSCDETLKRIVEAGGEVYM